MWPIQQNNSSIHTVCTCIAYRRFCNRGKKTVKRSAWTSCTFQKRYVAMCYFISIGIFCSMYPILLYRNQLVSQSNKYIEPSWAASFESCLCVCLNICSVVKLFLQVSYRHQWSFQRGMSVSTVPIVINLPECMGMAFPLLKRLVHYHTFADCCLYPWMFFVSTCKARHAVA